MAITVAEKVLIAGGVLNLAYGILLGYPITVIRAKGAPATPKYLMAAHVSALLHASSQIGRTLSRARRDDLVARIEAYRRSEVPLSVPVALLARYASGGLLPWLASQSYLSPFPAGLRLRHTV